MHKCSCCEWTRRLGPIELGGTLASKPQPKSHIGKHFCSLSTLFAQRHIKTKKLIVVRYQTIVKCCFNVMYSE